MNKIAIFSLILLSLVGCPDNTKDTIKPEVELSTKEVKISWEEVVGPRGNWDSIYRTEIPEGWLISYTTSRGTTSAIISDQNHLWGK